MAARKTVEPTWHKPPPSSFSNLLSLITNSGNQPLAASNGLRILNNEKVSPGAINKPFNKSAPRSIFKVRL
ncbi:MAG: hypothetical protein ACD_43C00045G0001 [uncultured bacterium]|nr:MAG: hypothetical protein ACD_43C00045G0001 [uncultured bacterium]